MLKDIGTGFNLGNTFDLSHNSTKLDDIRPIIDLYRKAGMRHMRIPVTWGGGFSDGPLADRQGRIDTRHPRLAQLTAAVDYALGTGMSVVVNTHHEHWLKDSYDGSASYDTAFAALWQGIATHFKSRPSRLIFEVLNEPEKAFGDWSGKVKPSDPTALRWTRQINAVGWKAIRDTGGPNTNRIVMVMPNGQGNQSQLRVVYPDRTSLPGGGKDRYLAATVHTYDPWPFCGQNGTNSAYPGKAAIEAPIVKVAAHARTLGIEVNYGEFGVGRDKNRDDRKADVVREYYRTVRQTALRLGMTVTPWDDRGWFGLVAKADNGTYAFIHDLVPAMLAGG